MNFCINIKLYDLNVTECQSFRLRLSSARITFKARIMKLGIELLRTALNFNELNLRSFTCLDILLLVRQIKI